jgi:hypothetical protein
MADAVTVDVDDAALLEAFESLPATIHTLTLAAAQVTAENIAREARARVPRRRGAVTAAQLARPPLEDLIVVLPMRNGTGYVVIAQDPAAPFLPVQLEYGTQHMDKRAFFFTSARLEQSGHTRRMNDALTQAIEIAAAIGVR